MFTLRSHLAPLTSLSFSFDGQLLSADESGAIFCWNVHSKRVVWKHTPPHPDEGEGGGGGGVLAVGWVGNMVWSQGRDHTLTFYRVDGKELVKEMGMNVNSIGFCKVNVLLWETNRRTFKAAKEMKGLVASVGFKSDNIIDIYHLPSTHRVWRSIGVPSSKVEKTGTVLSVQLFRIPSSHSTQTYLGLISAYESGHVACFVNRTTSLLSKLQTAVDGDDLDFRSLLTLKEGEGWELLWAEKGHREPVMDLALQPGGQYVWSVAADHRIIRYRILSSTLFNPTDISEPEQPRMKVYTTLSPGKSSISHRLDGKMFAVAGWDGLTTIYRTPTAAEEELETLATLKKHKGQAAAVVWSIPKVSEEVEEEEEESFLAVAGKDELISLWEYPE
ncbi:WD40 repeat-like protein [Atractiella rhizophila]|nr:WD40 repeat-like protein [Atractiella rhizophila]